MRPRQRLRLIVPLNFSQSLAIAQCVPRFCYCKTLRPEKAAPVAGFGELWAG
jgi:hypothetical protein